MDAADRWHVWCTNPDWVSRFEAEHAKQLAYAEPAVKQLAGWCRACEQLGEAGRRSRQRRESESNDRAR
ncbi:hypothetical protein MA16_Dca003128 [Dendrobium catenatum]|uniref:Uncharacterized protein n=1 Tax=Dendrobium catenatum TaxID=906689 RepID=A0A2I0XBV7_9ASPA|nr:hypothetical protein MA16_Dca003128 [Dendrobium catenatum]